MNWSEDREGPPPLPPGWQDAWLALHAGEPGFSYDAKNNAMLAHNSPRLRLDRVFAKLHDFRPARMAIVGTEPLPGVTHTHTFRSGSSKELPVLPSDHFGLLLTMDPV
jgi:tyrosyl-DNA phosphodiesterase 2